MTFRSKLHQQLQIWWSAAVVLAVGGALSIGLWHVLERSQTQTVQDRLNEQAQLFTSTLEQRLYAYADYIQVIKPLLEANPAATLEVFKSLKLAEDASVRFPGVEVLSLVRHLDAQAYAQRREALLRDVPPQLRVDESAMHPLPLTQSTYFMVDEVWPISTKRYLTGLNAELQPAVKAQITRVQGAPKPVMSASLSLRESGDEGVGVLISVPLHTPVSQGGVGALAAMLSISVRIDALVEQLRGRGMLPHTEVSIQDKTLNGASQDASMVLASHLVGDQTAHA